MALLIPFRIMTIVNYHDSEVTIQQYKHQRLQSGAICTDVKLTNSPKWMPLQFAPGCQCLHCVHRVPCHSAHWTLASDIKKTDSLWYPRRMTVPAMYQLHNSQKNKVTHIVQKLSQSLRAQCSQSLVRGWAFVTSLSVHWRHSAFLCVGHCAGACGFPFMWFFTWFDLNLSSHYLLPIFPSGLHSFLLLRFSWVIFVCLFYLLY